MLENVQIRPDFGPKVKVCGMRMAENIQAAKYLPIQFMGFIFYEPSSRFVEQYGKPDFNFSILNHWNIRKVGVFVNASVDYILEKKKEYGLDYVQLHGEENVFFCQKLKKKHVRIIKAFAVDNDFNFSDTRPFEFYCDFFLFDTKGALPGGNGVPFDWNLLQEYKGSVPFLLGGGISPESVDAIQQIEHPQFYAVDLNSRFESEPGLKETEQIRDFLDALRSDLNH
ncbi:MAG: phosphoribosylanthranilate isomerase [Bacteroidota bacterium]